LNLSKINLLRNLEILLLASVSEAGLSVEIT